MAAGKVPHAPTYYPDSHKPDRMPIGVCSLFVPAEVVVRSLPCELPRRSQDSANPRVQLVLELGHAPLIHHVFQARQLAIRTVAKIAMYGDDGCYDFQEFLRIRSHRANGVG